MAILADDYHGILRNFILHLVSSCMRYFPVLHDSRSDAIGGERLSVAGICAADPSMCVTGSNGLPLLNNQYLNSQGQYQLPAETTASTFAAKLFQMESAP